MTRTALAAVLLILTLAPSRAHNVDCHPEFDRFSAAVATMLAASTMREEAEGRKVAFMRAHRHIGYGSRSPYWLLERSVLEAQARERDAAAHALSLSLRVISCLNGDDDLP